VERIIRYGFGAYLPASEQEMTHDDFVQALAWLPDRRQLISASYDGKLRTWFV
jgi:WD40 repeat protein